MAKRKAKKKKAKSRQPEPGWYASLDGDQKRRIAGVSVRVLLIVAAAVGVTVGMAQLDRHVHAADVFEGRPELLLVDVPEELEPLIQQYLQPVADVDWTSPDLCRRIADRLASNGWVATVERVRRKPAGRIEIRCRYRTPFALVQGQDAFWLVDPSGVRLPGRYPFSPEFPLIQGVAGGPPDAGQKWDAADVAAALSLWGLLAAEPYSGQVAAVLVYNYGGRRDARSAHIELATDRTGGRIVWGSAPGEEIEENSAAQKLAILGRNYEVHGRIDAGLPVIDVSTFPDRFTTPSRL